MTGELFSLLLVDGVLGTRGSSSNHNSAGVGSSRRSRGLSHTRIGSLTFLNLGQQLHVVIHLHSTRRVHDVLSNSFSDFVVGGSSRGGHSLDHLILVNVSLLIDIQLPVLVTFPSIIDISHVAALYSLERVAKTKNVLLGENWEFFLG